MKDHLLDRIDDLRTGILKVYEEYILYLIYLFIYFAVIGRNE